MYGFVVSFFFEWFVEFERPSECFHGALVCNAVSVTGFFCKGLCK